MSPQLPDLQCSPTYLANSAVVPHRFLAQRALFAQVSPPSLPPFRAWHHLYMLYHSCFESAALARETVTLPQTVRPHILCAMHHYSRAGLGRRGRCGSRGRVEPQPARQHAGRSTGHRARPQLFLSVLCSAAWCRLPRTTKCAGCAGKECAVRSCAAVFGAQVHDSNGNPLYWIDVALANSLPEYALRWNARYF